MPLIFNTFQNAPPLPTSTYYAHVVTASPVGDEATVSGLSVANPSGYAPIDLTITTVVSDSITNWDFNDVLWSALNWNQNLHGVVIVLQIGASKNPAVDQPFLFYEFENGLPAAIVLTPGIFALRFSTGTDFALSVQPSNKYDVGGFIGFPLYKDLLTLLSSNNGTKYTPVSAITTNQISGPFGVYNPNFLSYWIGDRAMTRDIQSRHDIVNNNITF